MKTIQQYEEQIRECQRSAGSYTPALELNIHITAGCLLRYDLALRDVKALDSSVVVEETSRGTYTHTHPALKACRDAEAELVKQLKILGLTAEDCRSIVEEDKTEALSRTIHDTLGAGKIVKTAATKKPKK